MQTFATADLFAQRARLQKSYLEFLRVPSMSLGIYTVKAGETDPQKPHQEDEVYYVLNGRGQMKVGKENRAVQAGDIIFVEARVDHRFHSITEDMLLLVFFAPAESA
jgi:mannose-6-phosphate isomerase-like protein (cupin superfamily)